MDIVPSKFVRFDSDGLELVVNTDTGKAYASISATARMLETPRSTIQDAIAKGGDIYAVTDAQIQTQGGLQGCRVVTSFAVYKLAQKYHPALADRMGEAGANVYMLKLAGYEPKIVKSPQVPQTYAAALLEAGRLAMELEAAEAKIEADAPNTLLGETISKASNNIRIGEFAKSLVDANGKPMGQNKYFEELRECKIIMQTSTLPYQQFHAIIKLLIRDCSYNEVKFDRTNVWAISGIKRLWEKSTKTGIMGVSLRLWKNYLCGFVQVKKWAY